MKKALLLLFFTLFAGFTSVLYLVEWDIRMPSEDDLAHACQPPEYRTVVNTIERVIDRSNDTRPRLKYRQLEGQYLLWVDEKHRRDYEEDRHRYAVNALDRAVPFAGETFTMWLLNVNQVADSYDDFLIQLRKESTFHGSDDMDYLQDATRFLGDYDQVPFDVLDKELQQEVLEIAREVYPKHPHPFSPSEAVDFPTWCLYRFSIKPILPGSYTLNITTTIRNGLWSRMWSRWEEQTAETAGGSSSWYPPRPVYYLNPFVVHDRTPDVRRDILSHEHCDENEMHKIWFGPAQAICPDESLDPGDNAGDNSQAAYYTDKRPQWFNEGCATRQICKSEATECLRRFKWILVLGDSIGRELNVDLQHILLSPASQQLIWSDDVLKVVRPSYAVYADRTGLSNDVMKWRDYHTRRTCKAPQINWTPETQWSFSPEYFLDEIGNLLENAKQDEHCDHETLLEQSFFTATFDVNPEFDPHSSRDSEEEQTSWDFSKLDFPVEERLREGQTPLVTSRLKDYPDVCILATGMHKVWAEPWDHHEETLHRNLIRMGTPPSDEPELPTLHCKHKFVLLIPSAQHIAGVRTRKRILEWNKRTLAIAKSYGARVVDNFYSTDIVPEWCGGTHMSYYRDWVSGPDNNANTPWGSVFYIQSLMSQLCPDMGSELSYFIGGEGG